MGLPDGLTSENQTHQRDSRVTRAAVAETSVGHLAQGVYFQKIYSLSDPAHRIYGQLVGCLRVCKFVFCAALFSRVARAHAQTCTDKQGWVGTKKGGWTGTGTRGWAGTGSGLSGRLCEVREALCCRRWSRYQHVQVETYKQQQCEFNLAATTHLHAPQTPRRPSPTRKPRPQRCRSRSA